MENLFQILFFFNAGLEDLQFQRIPSLKWKINLKNYQVHNIIKFSTVASACSRKHNYRLTDLKSQQYSKVVFVISGVQPLKSFFAPPEHRGASSSSVSVHLFLFFHIFSHPSELPFCFILIHFCSIFTPCVPFSPLQSDPFTLPSNSLSHSRILSIFLHLSIFFPPLLPSLLCSPAAHKNSSFLSPEDSSVTQGFTAFLHAFSPSLSQYVSHLFFFCSVFWQHHTVFNSDYLVFCLFNTFISPFIIPLCFFSPSHPHFQNKHWSCTCRLNDPTCFFFCL